MKQHRKLFAVALLLCVAVLCSGCIKSDMSMNIHKDRSMDFSATYLVANTLANASTGSQTTQNGIDENSQNWKTLESRGYKLEKCAKDGYSGFKATRHVHSIDDLSKETGVGVVMNNFLNEDFDDSALFCVRRELLKDTYTVHLVYDLKDSAQTADIDPADLAAFTSSMEITYNVTLPRKANYHNATTVSADGLTYSWKIPYGTFTAIDYAFTLPSRNVKYGIIGIAVLLLLIAAVVFLIVRAKKRKAAAGSNEDLPAPKTPEEAAALQAEITGQPIPEQNPTVCPLCGGKVAVRTAGGAHAGESFAVCEQYPTCKFIKPAVTPQPAAPVEEPAAPEKPVEPTPAPVEEPKPAPVEEPAPAPVEEPTPAPVEEPKPVEPEKPANVCPLCGGKLTVRVAQNGPNAGTKYAVCEHYSATCKFAKPIQ